MKCAKWLLSCLVVLGLGAVPAVAATFDPTGIWEATDGESRYDVALCGDGTQLCAKLIWIKPSEISDRNRKYIDTFVLRGAERVSEREWRGNIELYGHSVNGSVTRLGEDVMQVRGCALLVVCERHVITRISGESEIAGR